MTLFLPSTCAACGGRFHLNDRDRSESGRALLCRGCRSSLRRQFAAFRCSICGIPLTEFVEKCDRCRRRPFPFQSHLSAAEHEGTAARVIHAYKFGGFPQLACVMAAMMALTMPESWRSLPLVPVPSARRAWRKRGFSPAPLLCAKLSRLTGQTVMRLLRTRNGRAQKTLAHDDRLVNALARLTLATGAKGRPVPASAVLVDDVFTTGATASAATNILRSSGVRAVYVLTFAMEY